MTGGTISGNTGGGVYVVAGSGGVFKKKPETAGGTSGVIYGSDGDEASNRAAGQGHAVYVSSGKKRNGTVREDEELDSTKPDGWDS
ncbi:MAG: hypothetical protein LBO80_04760 [Treponema sp.]|jgi:hypothetical protein|nr:hypothetical protein [Treponema sp.]